MKQAWLVHPGVFEIRDVEAPEAGPGQVLVGVRRTGICGSDLHTFHGTNPVIRPPIVLGHELSGVVVGVGDNVTGPATGERVVIEPAISCGRCRCCERGRDNLCVDLRVVGGPCHAGGLSEFVVVPAANAIPLPAGVSLEKAPLVEPMAFAMHAVRLAGASATDRVLILGSGTIGLCLAQALGTLDVGDIVCADLRDDRLALAARSGSQVVNVAGLSGPAYVSALTQGGEFDLVFDCVNTAETWGQFARLATRGGTVVLVGIPGARETVSLHPYTLLEPELVIRGANMYTRADFDRALELAATGRLPLDALPSREFPLTHVAEAFRVAGSPDSGVAKVLVDPTL